MERPRFSFPYTLQANAGDSRSVLSVKAEVKALSFDHKPTNDGQYLYIYISLCQSYILQWRGHGFQKRAGILRVVE